MESQPPFQPSTILSLRLWGHVLLLQELFSMKDSIPKSERDARELLFGGACGGQTLAKRAM